MTTTQSKEAQARQRLAERIDRGHLTQDERWALSELIRTVGMRAEWSDGDPIAQAAYFRVIVQEYRRLVPEGGA